MTFLFAGLINSFGRRTMRDKEMWVVPVVTAIVVFLIVFIFERI